MPTQYAAIIGRKATDEIVASYRKKKARDLGWSLFSMANTKSMYIL